MVLALLCAAVALLQGESGAMSQMRGILRIFFWKACVVRVAVSPRQQGGLQPDERLKAFLGDQVAIWSSTSSKRALPPRRLR